jgi:hypothetical protein
LLRDRCNVIVGSLSVILGEAENLEIKMCRFKKMTGSSLRYACKDDGKARGSSHNFCEVDCAEKSQLSFVNRLLTFFVP